MAYYECINKNNYIHIGDKFTVVLSGSHNLTTSATVCYIDKTTVCLLGDISLGNADWYTQCNYIWNYSIEIIGKEYTGTCRIPTHQQIYSKCASYKRDFDYWLSTKHNGSTYWLVGMYGFVGPNGTGPVGTLPFIEITF